HPSDPLLTKSTVSDLLHCSERTLERLVRSGEFPPPLRHGKEALWFESVVQHWLQTQREAQLAWVPKTVPAARGPAPLHHPTLFAMATPVDTATRAPATAAASVRSQAGASRRALPA
ncbi:MAG: helix-turn-helix domain-containing protein, partial [Burkholderiaceae bacterium]|nr:helix-turn-helix domain-containing protein [Burkholderiaceae bacterium]